MNLKGRIERMEQQRGRRDDEPPLVKLPRWLATAP